MVKRTEAAALEAQREVIRSHDSEKWSIRTDSRYNDGYGCDVCGFLAGRIREQLFLKTDCPLNFCEPHARKLQLIW